MKPKAQFPLWTYYLHIGALIGLSVAHPIFELLAHQPQFLVAHHAGLMEVLFLILLLILLIPAAITGAAYFLDQILGTQGWCRAAFVAPFVFILALLLGRSLNWMGSEILIAGAGILASASILVYHRSSTARLYLTYLSPAILIIPAFFLMQPSVQWVFDADHHGPAQKEEPPDVPIVIVVFDELSLNSLLDRQGEFDSTQFPNFSDLARHATWYRNTTTVSPSTRLSVPALLTGNIPRGNPTPLPILANYPNNLFLWLKGSHRLSVFESTTSLCPSERMKVVPFRDIREFLRGLSIIYLHRTLPLDLTVRLPDIRHGWIVPDQDRQRESSPLTRFKSFLAAISDAPGPSLHFIHVEIPHVPWIYLPSGKRYLSKGNMEWFVSGEVWKASEPLVTLGFQRYLLQVGFADRLLGQLLQELRAHDLYDRSLIIVTSDHGVSFRPGGNRRSLDEANLKDILNVPLLIKAPHQKQGQVSDRLTRTIDILPSIAGILGSVLPWPTDGISVTDTTVTENRDLFSSVPRTRFLHSRTKVCVEGQAFDVIHDGRRVRLDEVVENGNRVIFWGWAADLGTLKLADTVLIFADEELVYRGMSRFPRPDVSNSPEWRTWITDFPSSLTANYSQADQGFAVLPHLEAIFGRLNPIQSVFRGPQNRNSVGTEPPSPTSTASVLSVEAQRVLF